MATTGDLIVIGYKGRKQNSLISETIMECNIEMSMQISQYMHK